MGHAHRAHDPGCRMPADRSPLRRTARRDRRGRRLPQRRALPPAAAQCHQQYPAAIPLELLPGRPGHHSGTVGNARQRGADRGRRARQTCSGTPPGLRDTWTRRDKRYLPAARTHGDAAGRTGERCLSDRPAGRATSARGRRGRRHDRRRTVRARRRPHADHLPAGRPTLRGADDRESRAVPAPARTAPRSPLRQSRAICIDRST